MTVTVLAILNLVFGAFGLIGLVIGIIGMVGFMNMTPAPLPDKPAAPTDFMGVANELNQFILNESPNHKTYLMASVGLGTLRTLLLLLSGVGLLMMKRWGRSLAFLYVVVGLLGTAAEVG